MEGQFEPVRLAVEVTSNVLSETNEIVVREFRTSVINRIKECPNMKSGSMCGNTGITCGYETTETRVYKFRPR